MPTTTRTINRFFRWIVGLGAAAAVLLIVVVALILALRSSNQSADTAKVAANTSDCVNRVQAQRAYATKIVYDAQLRKTQAEVNYLRNKISRSRYTDVVAAFEDAQHRADVYRQAHPAGRC